MVAAGKVLIALTPGADLFVLSPEADRFAPLARYKVAEGATYAMPVVSGQRLFIQDSSSVALWTIE
ncbi:MAG: hypothetical protein D6766_08370 [Verrucomicrobia bacterium]|nr:MAG: hypothetical protein D6766_08370 [Verrucomicrobiota bacterium]